MIAWVDPLLGCLREHGAAALVTVAHTTGSTPREAGATMVVTSDGPIGTIGGGHLEFEAMRLARDMLLRDGERCALTIVRFPLAARLGQCCGGVATLALATLDARALPWIDAALSCARTNAPFAIVGRLSSGEDATQRIVVTSDHARGTLGDPRIDSAALAAARTRLATVAATATSGTGLVEFDAHSLFVHVVRPDPFDVLVFGNGHVGRALIQVLGALPARVRWIDVRESDFPASTPANVETIATDDPESAVAAAPRGAFVAVMTHSHAQDFDIVEAALSRDDWRYVGLIGSKAKRAQFERRLVARGLPPEALARLTCPIGAGRLRSKEPGSIAVGIVAEMLAVREAVPAQREAGVSKQARY